MKAGILLLLIGMVAGCSSDPSKPTAATATTAQADEEKEGVICTYEKPVGSFLKEKKCTTPEQREAESRQRGVLIDARNARDSGIPP